MTLTPTPRMVSPTFKTSIWMAAMTTQALNLIIGWRVSNATPFGVLEGLFVSYALLTSAGKASVHSSKMGMNVDGSLRRTTKEDILQSKCQSSSLSEM